jgi:hypothetical protein
MAVDIIARGLASAPSRANVLNLPAGSIAAPALTLGGDTTAGWYRNAASQWTFAIASTAYLSLLNSTVRMHNAVQLCWTAGASGNAQDTILVRDAANTIAMRNSTTAQAWRWYHTYTDASNYQRGALKTAAAYVEVAAETAGTGADDLDVLLTPAGAGAVRFGTHSAIGAEAVTGYITIKDAGGTARKVAVVS